MASARRRHGKKRSDLFQLKFGQGPSVSQPAPDLALTDDLQPDNDGLRRVRGRLALVAAGVARLDPGDLEGPVLVLEKWREIQTQTFVKALQTNRWQ